MNTSNPVPKNFGVRAHDGRFSVSCDFGGARFHVWTDAELKPESDTVCKNPPEGVPYHGEGYFRTRLLTRTKGQGKIAFEAMMKVAPTLRAAAIEAREAEQRSRDAERQAALHDASVRNAAHDLLAAAELILRGYGVTFQDAALRTILEQAVAKANVDKPSATHLQDALR